VRALFAVRGLRSDRLPPGIEEFAYVRLRPAWFFVLTRTKST
jgi:hypothetical protein